MSHVAGAVTCMVASTATRSRNKHCSFYSVVILQLGRKIAMESSVGLRGDIHRNIHCLLYVTLEVGSLIRMRESQLKVSKV